MNDQLVAAVGRPVFTADGVFLGSVREIDGDRFKVNTPKSPDVWLPHTAARAVTSSYVLLWLTRQKVRAVAREGTGDELPFLSAEGTSLAR